MEAKQPRVLVVSIDLEGTGLRIFCDEEQRDQPTEIGAATAVVYSKPHEKMDFEMLETFQTYTKTDRVMSDKVQAITKITAKTLASAPTFRVGAQKFLQYVHKVCNAFDPAIPRILIAHNADKYDIPMYVVTLESLGESAFKYFAQMRFNYSLDTLILSRDVVDTKILPRDSTGNAEFSLGGIYKALFHRPLVGAHGAAADCAALLELVLNQPCYWNAIEKDLVAVKPHYLSNLMRTIPEIVKRVNVKPSAQNTNKKTRTLNTYFSAIPKTTVDPEQKETSVLSYNESILSKNDMLLETTAPNSKTEAATETNISRENTPTQAVNSG